MSYLEGRYYEDERIALSPERQKSFPPKEYRKMRDLVSYSPFSRENEAKVFYLQAKYMENFEDDYPYERDVQYYYPTYQSLSLEELRGYFTWRTRLRHGELTKTSKTYAYIYIYELLHQIGSETKEDGLEKLIWFYEQYRVLEPQIKRYVRQWIVDYAVYYDLPPELVRAYADVDFDESLDALRQCDMVSDEVLFAAIFRLSTYHLEKSKAYGQYPAELMQITCGAYRRMNARYARRYERPYAEKLWTGPVTGRYEPFRSAVFYEHGSRAVPVPPGRTRSRRERNEAIGRGVSQFDGPAALMGVRSVTGEYVDYYEYRLTSERCYIREGNQWREERSYSVPVKSRDLGVFTRAVDRLVRDAYGVRPGLKAVDETKTMVKFIEEEIDSSFAKRTYMDESFCPRREASSSSGRDIRRPKRGGVSAVEQKAAMTKSILEQQKAQRPKIEFDLSLLDDIRKSSDAIGQKLMTEEERGAESERKTLTDYGAQAQQQMLTDSDTELEQLTKPDREEQTKRPIGTNRDTATEGETVTGKAYIRSVNVSTDSRGSYALNSGIEDISQRNDRLADCVLSGDALRFMQLLLYGGDWQGFLTEKHIMVSVLAEAVNEQLYDEFADVVIEFDGDVPVIVEDYLDDLKGMISK